MLLSLPFASLSQQKQTPGMADTVVKTITTKLGNFAAARSIEKAYLQFDKPYYAIGDTIYFKGYITVGAQHNLSALSGILYADLIGPDNKIYRSLKLPIVSGTTSGDFTLADSLKGGNYRVRAYTQWMRNEGESSFFEQAFAVASMHAKRIPESGTPKSGGSVSAAYKPAIKFLPEGGNLIIGNYSKVAFKAIRSDGLGIDVKGTVVDDMQAEICSFASSHLGMGALVFVPQAGRTYKANVAYADGTTGTIDLPTATNKGYTIAINNTAGDTIRLRVTAGNATANERLSLLGQVGGVVYYAAEKQSDSRLFTAVIPKHKFPTGIVQFTLFSQTGEPLNERLVFVNNNDQLKLHISTPVQSYAPRQKVTIDIDAKNNENTSSTGSFSVAVIDETAVPVDSLSENSILSNLLLTSDLKGTVEQPNYYFISRNENTQADLDNLMLTQGYRHFEWKRVLGTSQAPLTYQPEKTLQLTGTVTLRNKPLNNAKVTLFTKSGGGLLLDTVTDENGKFAFKDLSFPDSTQFLVQARIPKGQNAVMLNPDSVPQIPAVIFKAGTAAAVNDTGEISPAYLANQRRFYQEQQKYGINKHAIMLREVKIKSKKDFTKRSQNLNGAGNADQIVTAEELKDLVGATLAFRLRNKLFPLVGFDTKGIPFSTRPLDFLNPGPMLIVVDGGYMDIEQFNNLDPDRIQSIEILTSPNYATMYGTLGGHGIMVITSKRGPDYTYERYAPGVVTYHPQGYYKAREFYSPQYDNPKTNQKISDFRSTIYWKPDLITNKDGKATFSYFNSDNKGTYRVVIEGIDADGNLGRQVYRYTVE